MQDAFKLLFLPSLTERNRMTRRLLTAISRTLTSQWPDADAKVHFHGGASGPYVCGDPRCVSPGLDLENA